MKTLSDKILEFEHHLGCIDEAIMVENIKQFIRNYFEWLNGKHCHCAICSGDWIRENAGPKLIDDADHAKNEVKP